MYALAPFPSSKFHFFSSRFPSSSSPSRVVCHGGSDLQRSPCDLKLILHDTLDSSGIDTTPAREARKEFFSQIQKFCGIERQTSISINRCVDLGRTALCIGAEDDSLVSHSSVPLPVHAFIERLDDLSMDYCPHYSPSFDSSPENFLESLERYLYGHKILNNLKHAFWPFQHDQTKSLFLRAAHAANCVDRSDFIAESGSQLASAKVAQHRLDSCVWTSVRLGDMRRSLAACERIILLKSDANELRDYGSLLYHCGLYEQALKYMKLSKNMKSSSIETQSSSSTSSIEEEAADKLIMRLNLILMEQGWSQPSYIRNFFNNNSEPW